jgi:hypothetical protein
LLLNPIDAMLSKIFHKLERLTFERFRYAKSFSRNSSSYYDDRVCHINRLNQNAGVIDNG